MEQSQVARQIVPAEEARDRLLDAAEGLFYARGVQSVGMDQIRSASNLSLKTIYRLYTTKHDLVVAVLERRDARWLGSLADYVADQPASAGVEAIFDWLGDWFATPEFRGCAWINIFGELGGLDTTVVAAVQAHKRRFHEFIARTINAAGYPLAHAPAVSLLAEGAIVAASVHISATATDTAKRASRQLDERRFLCRPPRTFVCHLRVSPQSRCHRGDRHRVPDGDVRADIARSSLGAT